MKRSALLVFLLALTGAAIAAPSTPTQRVADLDWLVEQLQKHYTYRHKRNIDIPAIARLYRADAVAASDEFKWIALMERVTAELYDHHISLNTNTDTSPQLVPSGTDIWAEVVNGIPTITQVRPNTTAHRAGLRAGMTVASIAGEQTPQALTRWLPRALTNPHAEAESFALRTLLAGNHRDPRRFVACLAQVCKPFDLPPAQGWSAPVRVTHKMLAGNIGYLRIENSLGDTATIAEFDAALNALKNTKGLILDLRNTPSGGNTDTAEPILARFVASKTGYQRVTDPRRGTGAVYVKEVEPRAPQVTQPLVVLVDRWTGSMGEGMTIGLHGMKRATIIGTKMAGLLGGTALFELPNTKVGIRLPVEQLAHIDGTPREDFSPDQVVNMTNATADDPILAAGLAVLQPPR